MSPVVDVRDLTVADQVGRVVLAGMNLTVERGRVVALVGPSGSGKTTMLRAVAGALPAALRRRSGSVGVLGNSVPDLSAGELRRLRRAQIGFVGQDPASRLNPRMRVHRLLAEVAVRRDRAALEGLLTEERLPATADLLRRRPGQLSGGQQRRVALARALARRPALLLLDEPTAGMDDALREEIGALLGELATRQELAIAMACHDQKLVDQIADSVVEFEHRGAARTATPSPAHAATATPVGAACVLSVRGLSAWIGKPGRQAIIRDVDLDLRAGSALAIVGPSGSGKTTLVRAIVGLHHPATGRLELAGAPLDLRGSRRPREQRRRIQLVPQDPLGTLNPSQRIGTAIARPLLLHQRATKADAPHRVADLLAAVGLPADFTERYPHELSGGQRQRVAIARAIAVEPDVLLCDEITSALDPQTTEAVMQLLTRLRTEHGLGLLLISHDL
ncbi:MAG: ATP-binding cassette domain-containing protein, partial [Actinomycetota bacterium]|nr:ATP-binding cassette domain-containing protein [Actinomycetota bacterium]